MVVTTVVNRVQGWGTTAVRGDRPTRAAGRGRCRPWMGCLDAVTATPRRTPPRDGRSRFRPLDRRRRGPRGDRGPPV